MPYKNFYLKAQLLVLILIAVLFYSCSNDRTADWTIMVYMAADNNLTEQAVKDIIDMERAKLPSSVNVIVQLDPNQQYNDPQTRRYKIKHNRQDYIASPIIEYIGDIDSGDYLSLVDFVNWSISRYPATKYALFIWSHGTGWSRTEAGFKALCPDGNSYNQISVAQGQLRRAFEMFSQKIDILVLDACLMFTMEVITEVSNYTNYVVGSQEQVPFEGFPYKQIFNNWNSRLNSEMLAKSAAHYYIESYRPGGSQNPHNDNLKVTGAAIKTAELNNLLDLLNGFTAKWMYNEYYQYIDTAREQCYNFHPSESEIDIYEFFYNIKALVPDNLRSDIDEIISAIDKAFVYYSSINLPEETGKATMWFPLYEEFLSGSNELYSNLLFAQQTQWLDFLKRYFENRQD